MSYLHYLQQGRWIKGWSDNYGGSFYSIRIGNDGRNGCGVPSLTKDEEYAITKWFGQNDIDRDAFGTKMWWRMENVAFWATDTIYQSGIEFRISADAYEKLFKKE